VGREGQAIRMGDELRQFSQVAAVHGVDMGQEMLGRDREALPIARPGNGGHRTLSGDHQGQGRRAEQDSAGGITDSQSNRGGVEAGHGPGPRLATEVGSGPLLFQSRQGQPLHPTVGTADPQALAARLEAHGQDGLAVTR